ncbi:MAG: glycosyltransferase family 4 protein [Chloroflexota bacterium]|nr:glycosyltransferase family 4 protein [Chloroflexota bacterium]
MRILLLSWEFPPYVVGGMGKHVAELVPALGKIGDENGLLQIDVLTTNHAGGEAVEQFAPNVTVHRVDMPPVDARDLYNSVIANNSTLIDYAASLIDHKPYDLIHLHDWLVGEAGIALKQRWKIPLLATIHATERGRHQGYISSHTSAQIDHLEWRICFEAWRLIVCSQFMRGEVHYYFGAPYDKVDTVANGLETANLSTQATSAAQALRRHYAPNGEKLLFFVGRMVHEKGLHVLLQAMPGILAQHFATRLLVAGKNSNKLLPLARDLGVEQVVDFLGYVSDAERDSIYQIADAAIFPSLYEPFGVVALEAMAQNCNVIVSHVGGLSEVVEHGVNGLTVYPNDPQSIGWAVNQLFTDPDAAAQRRRYAREKTLPLYTWEKIAAQTAQVYAAIAGARARIDW